MTLKLTLVFPSLHIVNAQQRQPKGALQILWDSCNALNTSKTIRAQDSTQCISKNLCIEKYQGQCWQGSISVDYGFLDHQIFVIFLKHGVVVFITWLKSRGGIRLHHKT